ncbi:glutamate-5-semialdehyde dehydrogenase [Aquibacillus kalidii]|uniref:glutamate-5-semialdehyde dehydrogenase n=1 Tax=Aquibacillus kalidii TaxID=2762597 RepID=UPI00164924D2|nr:glutamate-5-semialdehyde dehydrogenase [Aquibacillus kalidii]
MSDLLYKAQLVKDSAILLGQKTTKQKNDALKMISEELLMQKDFIINENTKDIDSARANGFHESLIDRLILDINRITDMSDALRELTKLNDPIGEIIESWERPNGLKIDKISVPIGVVGMIYEARPNVTVDAASLCLKTGNAVLLRGSSSAIHSNQALVQVIQQALAKSELPKDCVQLVEDTSRETASKMFKMSDYLDVLIPRGGKKLIQTVVEQASVPVIETGAGNCHLFIDATADVKMALEVAVNAKTQRPSVCNAIETLVIHRQWGKDNISRLLENLVGNDVELRLDPTLNFTFPKSSVATEEDWDTEFLDKILAVKVVDSLDEAINHIRKYSSKHSESILTESDQHAVEFLNKIDAAVVYHNASTRFTDGFEFGFGAEIGISTQKLHARGPMGLPALTSTKYIVRGDGQIK